MKRFKHSILLLIISIVSVSAQNNTDAQKITNDLLNSLRTTAIRTNFQLSATQKNPVTSHSVSGTFILKGNKFMLDMTGAKAWFDGKTQWMYVASNKEVTVTEPSEAELADVNPLAILSKYTAKSYIGFSKVKSAANQVIELTPKSKKDDFLKIEVQVSKSTGNLVSIRMIDKKGGVTHLTLSNYQKGISVNDNTFVFDKSKFKGVSINDLR